MPPVREVPGTAQRAAYLGALRSPSPSQWTDNRLEQSQHLVGAVYVAVKVLADQAASAQVNVYRLKPEAKSAEDQDAREALPHTHELSQFIQHPNTKETGGMLRRKWVNQVCLTGSAISWRIDNGIGTPAELWNIETATAQPILPSAQFSDGGYRVTPYYGGPWMQFPGLLNSAGVQIPSSEILSMGFPHPLIRTEWFSPLTASSLQLDALEAIDKSRWHGMKQSINPSGVVEVDPSVAFPDQEDLDRLKTQFGEKMGGVENSGRLAVMSPGLTLKPWSHAPAAMGWEQSWSQLVDFVLSVFGANKSLAMMTTEQSYASLYASLKQFNLFTMCPLLNIISDAINVQIVWPYFGQEYFVEFVPAAIDDEQIKQAEIAADDAVGLYTINERRAMRKKPPVEWGEIRCQPGSVQEKDPGASLADTDPKNDAPLGAGGNTGAPDESPPEIEKDRPESGEGEGSLPGKTGKRFAAQDFVGKAHTNGKALVRVVTKARDAEGHEHGADGRFGNTGAGAGDRGPADNPDTFAETHAETSGRATRELNRQTDRIHKEIRDSGGAAPEHETALALHAEKFVARVRGSASKAWRTAESDAIAKYGDTPAVHSLLGQRKDQVRDTLDSLTESVEDRTRQAIEQDDRSSRDSGREDVENRVEKLHAEIDATGEYVGKYLKVAVRGQEMSEARQLVTKLGRQKGPPTSKQQEAVIAMQGSDRWATIRQDPESNAWEIHNPADDAQGSHYRFDPSADGIQMFDSETKEPTSPNKLAAKRTNKSIDASGHEHAADGKFGTGGGQGSPKDSAKNGGKGSDTDINAAQITEQEQVWEEIRAKGSPPAEFFDDHPDAIELARPTGQNYYTSSRQTKSMTG